jgi:tetratricopeptide (TPR) repeat protein
MTKVVKFPGAQPMKFGLEKARKKKRANLEDHGQLNLFGEGKVVRLSQLSTFEEALILDERGDQQKARELYLKAIEEGPEVADAYCNLGIIESQLGSHARAIDCFTHSLKHDPRHYESHYNLANLYAEVGNYGLAKVHYGIAIEVEPDFPNSYFNMGLTLAMNREYKDAAQALNRYIALTPSEEHAQAHQLVRQLMETF